MSYVLIPSDAPVGGGGGGGTDISPEVADGIVYIGGGGPTSTTTLSYNGSRMVVGPPTNAPAGVTFFVRAPGTGAGYEVIASFNKTNAAGTGVIMHAKNGATRVAADFRDSGVAQDLVLCGITAGGTFNDTVTIGSGGSITATNAVTTVGSATGAWAFENTHVDAVSSLVVRHTSGTRRVFVESYGSNAGSTIFGATRNSSSVIRSLGSTFLAIGTGDAVDLIFGTNDAERARISSAGNVGINCTPAANARFLVQDAGTASDTARLESTATGGVADLVLKGGGSGNLTLVSCGSTIGGSLFGVSRNSLVEIRASAAASGMVIGTDGADWLMFGTNNTERMRITDTGLVIVTAADAVVRMTATGVGGTSWDLHSRQTDGDFRITPSPFSTPAVAFANASADTETALFVCRDLGGVETLQRVTQGAADSGGAGYRLLRVPN